jgi:hypothetical protein
LQQKYHLRPSCRVENFAVSVATFMPHIGSSAMSSKGVI